MGNEMYRDMAPKQVRSLIAEEKITGATSGMCAGFAQANLVILNKEDAKEFEEFALNNPKPCPIIEITQDTYFTSTCAEKGNILSEIPKYRIWKNGQLAEEPLNVEKYWQEGMSCFLIGCSFSFEEALIRGGIEVRHIALDRNVPMYRSNISCKPSALGKFYGPVVVSMRPMTREQAEVAIEITSRFPRVHGAPIHVGDPKFLGISDIMKVDYGDTPVIKDGEIPVFWACGVTPQAAIEQAKLPLVITHAPGHMFITDLLNESLAQGG